MHRMSLQLQNQRSASLRVRFPRQQQQNSRRVFHRAAEPEPGIERHVANQFGRNVADIYRDKTEAAALQQQIRGAQGLLDGMAAHPEQFFQVHAGRRRGTRIKRVGAIDQRAGFVVPGSGAER